MEGAPPVLGAGPHVICSTRMDFQRLASPRPRVPILIPLGARVWNRRGAGGDAATPSPVSWRELAPPPVGQWAELDF